MANKMINVRLQDPMHHTDVTEKPYVLHSDRYIGEIVDHVRYELGIGTHVKVTIVHGTNKISERKAISDLAGQHTVQKTIKKRPSQSIKQTVKSRCVVEDNIGVLATTEG